MMDLLDQLFRAAIVAAPSLWIGAAFWHEKSWWLQAQGFGLSVFITWFLLLEMGVWK